MEKIPVNHKAVRLHHPGYDVRVEELPTPTIEHPSDAIVKVKLAGLCGSDMHTYRGHQIPKDPFIMGHEFIGTIVALGEDYTSPVATKSGPSLKLGDFVVSPFTSSCGKCQSCRLGYTARCSESLLFGHPLLPGAQAQYVRVPNALATLFKIPPDATTDPAELEHWTSLSPESLILLADILPTGCFAAIQALQHPNILPFISGLPFPMSSPLLFYATADPAIGKATQWSALEEAEKRLTLAIIGLGPVGLCATVALLHLLERHKCTNFRIVAIDLVEERRQKAKAIVDADPPKDGVVEIVDGEEAKRLVAEWTGGVGCSAVLEVVGYNPALALAYELVRPFGVITSVGVHQAEPLPFTGSDCYKKNISMVFGRCPVRSMFPMALDVLLQKQQVFSGIGTSTCLVERIEAMTEENVKKSYTDFDKGRCGKVLFDPWM